MERARPPQGSGRRDSTGGACLRGGTKLASRGEWSEGTVGPVSPPAAVRARGRPSRGAGPRAMIGGPDPIHLPSPGSYLLVIAVGNGWCIDGQHRISITLCNPVTGHTWLCYLRAWTPAPWEMRSSSASSSSS